MQEQRSFVNPNDDEAEIDNGQLEGEIGEDGSQRQQQFDDLQMDDGHANCNQFGGDFFETAESALVGATPRMLETIKEVAEELLASSVIPFRREGGCKVYSESEIKAREKLRKLGLSELQISRLIEFELKKQSRELAFGKKKESRNLVYEASKRQRKQKQNVHCKDAFRKKKI